MKLLFLEIKKILRPVPLLIMAAFTGLYGFTLIKGELDWLIKYHVTCDEVELAADLIRLCGTTWEPDEVEAAVATLTEQYAAEIYDAVKNEPLFAAAGVTDYESFMALRSKIGYSRLFYDAGTDARHTEFLEQLRQDIIDGVEVYPEYGTFDPEMDYTLTPDEQRVADEILWDVSSSIKQEMLADYVSAYNMIPEVREYYVDNPYDIPFSASAAGMERVREILDGAEFTNILPTLAANFVKNIYFLTIIMVIATILFMLAPVVTKDNMSGVTALQYSSKTGRRTGAYQLAAMLITAFIIAAVEVAVVFGALIAVAWHDFLGSGLNSFGSRWFSGFNWFAGTYGQYLAIVFVMMLAVSVAAAMFVFALSKKSSNYITLLLAVVPTGAALIGISYLIFADPFAIFGNAVFRLIPYIEAYICAALLLIGAAAAGLLLSKQKRTDVA